MNKPKGFTLIELMIVIAILAIVASIIIGFVKDNDSSEATPVGVSYTNGAVQRLVCVKGGVTVRDEPAIPGERWYFENGNYVTNDANGNPVSRTPNGDCEIK